LLKYALLHLSNFEDAQDCTQEALLAAIASPASYSNRASYKTYIFSILKNKVSDCLRRRYRNHANHSSADHNDFVDWFDGNGHWSENEEIAKWDDPADSLASKQFLAALDICIHNLPPRIAQIFSLKEFMDYEPETICVELEVSKEVYWQSMSRARKIIQACLHIRHMRGSNGL
jgi:RNA polymerase sigma-70 factor, ECF subfamily